MKELNQWDLLQSYAASKETSDAFLLLESAWRIPNWPLMKEAIFQVFIVFISMSKVGFLVTSQYLIHISFALFFQLCLFARSCIYYNILILITYH